MPRKRPAQPPEPQQPASARIPLGEPLDWSDAEIDALAAVTPQDVQAARAWVARNAEPEDRGLWTAEPEEDV